MKKVRTNEYGQSLWLDTGKGCYILEQNLKKKTICRYDLAAKYLIYRMSSTDFNEQNRTYSVHKIAIDQGEATFAKFLKLETIHGIFTIPLMRIPQIGIVDGAMIRIPLSELKNFK